MTSRPASEHIATMSRPRSWAPAGICLLKQRLIASTTPRPVLLRPESHGIGFQILPLMEQWDSRCMLPVIAARRSCPLRVAGAVYSAMRVTAAAIGLLLSTAIVPAPGSSTSAVASRIGASPAVTAVSLFAPSIINIPCYGCPWLFAGATIDPPLCREVIRK